MYKGVSKFMQRSGIWSAGYGCRDKEPTTVICFWKRNDNQGQERVFRFVKKFTTKERAESFFDESEAPFKAMVYRGEILHATGDMTLVMQWRETQKGVNRDIDPFL